MVRYLLLIAFMALHTMIFSTWALVLSLFDRTGEVVHVYCAVPWARVSLFVCGSQVAVRGLENVESQIPRIYLSNHQSAFDIFALLAFLPVHFKFVLKQELMRIPLFGPAMRGARYIGIERDDPRKAVKSVNEAAERIKQGASVVLFPEGTRSADGQIQSFKPGAFHLALKSGCDIVPVTIQGSYRVMPKGSFRINKGTFTLMIGKPIPVKGVSKKDIENLIAHVRDVMIRQMDVEKT